MRGMWMGKSLFLRLSALTLSATFGSLLLGVWIDHTLGMTPFCTLGLMVLGILVGTISVYRTVAAVNQQITSRKS